MFSGSVVLRENLFPWIKGESLAPCAHRLNGQKPQTDGSCCNASEAFMAFRPAVWQGPFASQFKERVSLQLL